MKRALTMTIGEIIELVRVHNKCLNNDEYGRIMSALPVVECITNQIINWVQEHQIDNHTCPQCSEPKKREEKITFSLDL